MRKILNLFFIVFSVMCAETLFEVKDSSDNPVLNVSTDGLRILSEGDTLMVISSQEIKANIGTSGKGLSRSFSVTTTQSKGSGDLMRLTSDSTRFWISDEGSGFGVASQAATSKSVATDFLKVTNANTQMREGVSGDTYTDFSPENIFLGLNGGENTVPSATTGINNVFIGNQSGVANSSGYRNVFVGQSSGNLNTLGFNGLFLGYQAGYSNTQGFNNIFLGSSSGYSNTTGYNNIFIGTAAGQANTEGLGNIFIGDGAGINNIGDPTVFEGYNNIFLGNQSGYENITGSTNVYVGSGTGFGMTGGESNVFIGTDVGRGKTGGDNNVMVGYRAGYGNSTGEKNVFLGYQQGYSETGSEKLYIGAYTTPLIYGEFNNKKVGINTTSPAAHLEVVGGTTLATLMVAPSEATSGDDSEIVLAEDNDGTFNMSMKYDGELNRLEWWAEDDAGTYGPLMTLAYNTLGGGIPYLNTGFIRPLSDNTFDLGYSTLRWDDIYATNGVIQTSDKRQKSNIESIGYGIDTVMKLKPVTYFWKDKPERGRKVGLIAQDVLNLVPEIVDIGEDEEHTLGINYAEITPILIKAVQEQQGDLESLKEENKNLNKILEEQHIRIKKLEEALKKIME